MTRTIRARFTRGVFEPLDPALREVIADGEEVLLTIVSGAEDGDALLETAGAWKDLVDAERLKHDIYEDRLVASRPPVQL